VAPVDYQDNPPHLTQLDEVFAKCPKQWEETKQDMLKNNPGMEFSYWAKKLRAPSLTTTTPGS